VQERVDGGADGGDLRRSGGVEDGRGKVLGFGKGIDGVRVRVHGGGECSGIF